MARSARDGSLLPLWWQLRKSLFFPGFSKERFQKRLLDGLTIKDQVLSGNMHTLRERAYFLKVDQRDPWPRVVSP